ncbi:MAG: DUF2490 domain-containing protein [Bacteroidota bacterium]
MKWISIIAIALIGRFSFAQEAYQQNSWGSLVWNHQWRGRIESIADIGHRRCDGFVYRRRQALGRLTVLYRFRNGFSAGLGFAWFQHSSLTSAITNEYRPFLQAGYRSGKKRWNWQLRFRQEWRLYPSVDKHFHRTRLQLQLRRTTHFSCLEPVVSIEGFSTIQSNILLESRITVGNNFKLRNQTLFLFYTLQNQTSVDGNQHIIGLQFNIKTGNNENESQ